MRSETVQRLRLTFGVRSPLCYASVLDMGRLWERLLRRARVPLAYTQGFNPHPRLQFADALPVGYDSVCELVDMWLSERQDFAEFAHTAREQAPAGLDILAGEEVTLNAVSPQSTMRQAEYRVSLDTPSSRDDLAAAVERILTQPSLIRRRMKKGELAEYDLRPLVYEIELLDERDGQQHLRLLLRCGSQGAGRPEEVVAALELPIRAFHVLRTGLIWGAVEEQQS